MMKEGQKQQKQKHLPIVLLTIVSIIGLLLSCYAIYVDYRIHMIQQQQQQQNNDNELSELNDFVALCDIKSIGASCSKVFQLPVGKLVSYFNIVPIGHILDIPNAAIGIVFYIYQLVYLLVQMMLSSSSSKSSTNNNNKTILLFWKRLTTIITTLATSASIFLAYHLTFIVYDLCILCWTTHFINGILFYFNVIQYCLPTGTTTTKDSTTAVVVPKIKRV